MVKEELCCINASNMEKVKKTKVKETFPKVEFSRCCRTSYGGMFS